MRQERAQAARELQKMWEVAQPPEAKVGGAANPLPQVAKVPQPWVGGLAGPPWDAPAWHMPPNLPAGRVLTAQKPPLPPPRWAHLFLGGLPPPPILLHGSREPALCLSRPGAATLPVRWVPYPRPSS